MNELIKLKNKMLQFLIKQLDEKIDTLSIEIASTIESRNNDTKSSAGDKFETGREMMQAELNKNEDQLNKTLKDKHDLLQINATCSYSKVEFGSLVITNMGNYFISLPIGKITVENEDVYCISLASPIGQAMVNKENNETFIFNGNLFSIENIN